MLERERKARNGAKLQEMHPDFRARVEAVLVEMESYRYRPRIQEAWRSPEEQAEAFRRGRSKIEYGYHNVTAPDGTKEALAADIIDDNRPLGPKLHFILHLTAAAEKNGLTSGVYFDLAPEKALRLKEALAAENWNAAVHIGWDPCHVQTTAVTIEEAREGKRPGDTPAGQPPASGPIPPAAETPAPTPGTPPPAATPTPTSDTPIPPPVTPPPTPDEPAAPPASGMIRFRVTNTATNQTRYHDLGTALRPVSLLPVPYISQVGQGADAHRNDCGAASAAMLVAAYLGEKITPDEFYTRFNIPGDRYLSQAEVRDAMGSLGLMSEFKANLSLQELFTYLASGKPVIALLRYRVLRDAGLTESDFQGPHFLVVVGIDSKNVYVHDPLFSDPAKGQARPYPLELFWQAWKEIAQVAELPNPERSAIVPNVGIGYKLTRRVRINVGLLSVREGPGLNFKLIDKRVKNNETYEVTRELNGWGEIAENEWIYLAYTIPAD
ncbi:MAG: C39 family peptidase [Anaerolineales bacterium]|nr:C39 family peptidase [Anaerolineales bacterium]